MSFKKIKNNRFEFTGDKDILLSNAREHLESMITSKECYDELINIYIIDISSILLTDIFINDLNTPSIESNKDRVVISIDEFIFERLIIAKLEDKLVWSTE